IVNSLIDNGAHLALIHPDLVCRLGLSRRILKKPEPVCAAFQSGSNQSIAPLTEYVLLKVSSVDGSFTSRNVPFVIAPNLCTQLLLGLPWLTHNSIVIDYTLRSCTHKPLGFDLLNNKPVTRAFAFKTKSIEKIRESLVKLGNRAKEHWKKLLIELKNKCSTIRPTCPPSCVSSTPTSSEVIASIRSRIEDLATLETLKGHESRLKEKYRAIFEPIPHVDELPTSVTAKI
ncbi:hypothetical protein C8R41DRAFT_724973, partial [Lentinula lateritia]